MLISRCPIRTEGATYVMLRLECPQLHMYWSAIINNESENRLRIFFSDVIGFSWLQQLVTRNYDSKRTAQ